MRIEPSPAVTEQPMKIFYSPTSPFVRKCLVAARELGLHANVELVSAAPHPVTRDRTIVAHNPLGQVPTLICDEGTVLYDSRVISEYFDALAGGGRILPRDARARWNALTEQSLADGILDAAVLARYETAARPEALRWKEWIDGQIDKVTCGLADLEKRAPGFGERIDVGTIAVGCALGYLDFRYASLAWRGRHAGLEAWYDRFGARESMVATRPPPA